MSALVAAVCAAAVFLPGCDDTTEPQTRTYEVGVDSISAPDSVPADEPFLVRVWALIGPNLCHRFAGFEVAVSGSHRRVTVLGEVDTSPGECPTALAEIQGKGLAINPPYEGSEVVLVFEMRDGGTLTHTVQVTPSS